jgi:hypothetical protein
MHLLSFGTLKICGNISSVLEISKKLEPYKFIRKLGII